MKTLQFILIVALLTGGLANIGEKVVELIEDRIVNAHEANLSLIEPRFHLYVQENHPLYTFEWGTLIGSEPPEVQRVLRRLSKLVILVHGFRESSDSKWMHQMVEVQTRRGSAVLLVDWRKGAEMTATIRGVQEYAKAARNVPLMGCALSRLVQGLMSRYDIKPSDVEFIGFSLGAQIGGYVTKRLAEKGVKISRLVALDAAAPLFINHDVMPSRDHVDFLEAVHTSSGEGKLAEEVTGHFGIDVAFGHVDFYPNGGKHQPGCKKSVLASCSHNRAHKLYLEALRFENQCHFVGVRCDSYQQALKGDCTEDEAATNSDMPSYYLGMPATRCGDGEESCVFYVPTTAHPPFCQPSTFHYENMIWFSPKT